MCVWRVCKGVRTPPNHQTSLFRAGQRPAVCFLLLYFTPWLFLPLLVLRGVSVLYRQTPTLSCSLPSSQTGLNIVRERESREEEEVSCLDKRTPRAGCGGSLPSGCVGLALLHIHTHTTGVGGQNLPSSHTNSFFNPTPSPTLFDPPPFVLPFPRLLPVAAPCSPSLLNKERFRGEGVKGARGNSYVCVCESGQWLMHEL